MNVKVKGVKKERDMSPAYIGFLARKKAERLDEEARIACVEQANADGWCTVSREDIKELHRRLNELTDYKRG